MIKRTRQIAAAAALALGSLVPLAAQSAVIQLGFILDRSGSITQSNWDIIVGGLSSAVGSLIPVGGPDTYEVSVVTFAASASININSFTVTDATQRGILAGQIAALTTAFVGGGTQFAPAFTAMQTALTDGVGTNGSTTLSAAAASYINFATDGVNTDDALTAAARASIIAAGVDNISVEGIGGSVDVGYLQTQICHPTPCDATSPYDFPSKGFYIAVADANAYVNAIENKIRVVTNQTPEPASLALVGLALAGAGLARRRTRAA